MAATKLLALSLFFFVSFANADRELSCRAYCQAWDSFSESCLYHTSCELQKNCMTETYCEHWDNFSQKCAFEAEKTYCHTAHPWLPAPSCKVSCQYWDDFTNTCLYKTKCEYYGNCLKTTRCEAWDSFSQKCASEEYRWECP